MAGDEDEEVWDLSQSKWDVIGNDNIWRYNGWNFPKITEISESKIEE